MKTEHSRSYVTLFITIAGGKRSFFSPKYNFEIASNLIQRWIRPIKREKRGGKDKEFEIKINASVGAKCFCPSHLEKDDIISHGGVAMGKKPKRSKYEKYKERRKNNERSEIEGKFGTVENCKHAIYHVPIPTNRTRLQQTTFASINMMFLAMNLLKLSGRGVIIMRPCKEYIFFGVFALVITAISDIKYELTELFDKYLRLSLAQGGNQMRLQRMRLTF